jgi:ABC-type uncharacterized transport system ATPase subunit
MGQRKQRLWDLPVLDSLERNRAIYHLPAAAYRESLGRAGRAARARAALAKRMRNLSLGERMT